MKTNDILNIAKTFNLPFEIEEWEEGIKDVDVSDVHGQRYFSFREIEGRVCIRAVFGIKGSHGYVEDETIENMIKELAE